MHIAWADLGQVFLVGLVAGAGIVALFAVGVLGLSRAGGGEGTGKVIAVTSFAICAAGLLYGLYIAVPALH